ncbi:MAG: glycoside-pentoside-hexuronide (GPH):cation symporter [Firmicutes bacterium]|nr:glycoside-pentoside-hexuronide (GPH):cation symporter [Bacillota bacterium]
MAKKEKKPGFVPLKEQISYYAGSLGSGLIYSIMSSYILDFYMNVAKLNWVFVLLLMLLARIWDAVNDPMMGVLMDRLNPKRGKMRTWLFAMPGVIMVFTILIFVVPDFSPVMKMVYAAITYVGWGMTFTAMDIPFWSLPLAMTPDEKERGTTFSLGRTANGVGAAIPMALVMLLPLYLEKTISDDHRVDVMKYLITAVICAAAGGALLFQTPFQVKERVPLPKDGNGGKGSLRRVLACKPLVLTALMGILSGGRYMYQAGMAHVARWALSVEGASVQKSMSSVQMTLSIAMAVGMFASMVAVPLLTKKFNYKQLLIGSCLVGGLAGIATFAVGYEIKVPLLFFLLLLSAIPVGVINVVAFAMVGDSLDYMEWGTGFRANGLGLACQSFVIKLANALATSAITVIYPLVGLNPSESQATRAETNFTSLTDPVQQAAVRKGFFSIISIVPAISLLVSIIPILFYDLTGKKQETIARELAERRAAAEEQASEA